MKSYSRAAGTADFAIVVTVLHSEYVNVGAEAFMSTLNPSY